MNSTLTLIDHLDRAMYTDIGSFRIDPALIENRGANQLDVSLMKNGLLLYEINPEQSDYK